MDCLALILTLPTKASTGRMRIWRALKTLGCATLRDGVYLLPESAEHAVSLREVAADALSESGSAEIYRLSARDAAQADGLRALFDRTEDYAALAVEAQALGDGLAALDAPGAARKLQALVRRLEQLERIDFFPGEARRQTRERLESLRTELGRRLSPDEPSPRQADIPRLERAAYQGRAWATRARPWVDRLASAWLIRRHIDDRARIVWLAQPADCRPDWLGFDFDGATFSHVGTRVTFETLLASFGLEADAGLVRLGRIVHCLDVGGLPAPEAAGLEALLAGMRAGIEDDDALLDAASTTFDYLYTALKEHP